MGTFPHRSGWLMPGAQTKSSDPFKIQSGMGIGFCCKWSRRRNLWARVHRISWTRCCLRALLPRYPVTSGPLEIEPSLEPADMLRSRVYWEFRCPQGQEHHHAGLAQAGEAFHQPSWGVELCWSLPPTLHGVWAGEYPMAAAQRCAHPRQDGRPHQTGIIYHPWKSSRNRTLDTGLSTSKAVESWACHRSAASNSNAGQRKPASGRISCVRWSRKVASSEKPCHFSSVVTQS